MDLYTETNNKFFKLSNLLTEEVRGEWWIDDYGQAVFADGDSGDINHEGYVIQILSRDLLERFGIDSDEESVDLADHEEEIQTALSGEEYDNIVLFKDKVKAFLRNNFQKEFSDNKKIDLYIAIVLGSTQVDARVYALQYWGWKRMKGNDIETQTLTDEDLKIISRGINNAYGDEIESEEEPFNIEVLGTHQYYQDVPLSVIESGNPTNLNEYR